jgi:hypothetical protein
VLQRSVELAARTGRSEKSAFDLERAGAGESLKPCCYVNAITKQVTALYHHITNVDADPEVDATVG